MEREVFLERRIRELANTSYRRGIGTFSDFLNLSEQDLLYRVSPLQNFGVYTCLWGGYPDAERQTACFLPSGVFFAADPGIWEEKEEAGPDSHGIIHMDPAVFEVESVVCCLKIDICAPRYAQKLSHRDYLGSILGQGLERNVIGDILVEEEGAYVFCDRKIAGFLVQNLTQVSRTKVELSFTQPGILPQSRMESFSDTVASIRLDSLVAAAFHEPRSLASSQIESGLVFVNGRLILSHSFAPSAGDIISVRHKGRFRFEEETGKTRKGRCQIRIARFV